LHLEYSLLYFIFFEDTYLIGFGKSGMVYSIDLTSSSTIMRPIKQYLRGIDDILSVHPLEARKNQYLLATNKGLHVAEVRAGPDGKPSVRLCASDQGDDALSPFAFYDMRISAAVEYAPDKVFLTTRGRTRIYEVDLKTR
jgi:hypothetical protein